VPQSPLGRADEVIEYATTRFHQSNCWFGDYMAAFGGKADISHTFPNVCF
jgi:hypothetical protein